MMFSSVLALLIY